jgi:hypothetical protein
VANRAGIQHAELVQCHVHIGNRPCFDTIIGSERTLHGIKPPIVCRFCPVARRHLFRTPQLGRAGTVFVPTFHRAAQTRSGIGLRGTGKFIVAPRHRIQHKWGHATIHLIALRGMLQQIHDARQGEACTGVGLLLIEHRDTGLRFERQVRHHRHRRHIDPVAQIKSVGDCNTFSIGHRAGRFHFCRGDVVSRHGQILSQCKQTRIEKSIVGTHTKESAGRIVADPLTSSSPNQSNRLINTCISIGYTRSPSVLRQSRDQRGMSVWPADCIGDTGCLSIV